ncbi:MAG TPA: nitroreductase family protein [Candidatus Binatia bacterium]|jgi:nitroreductase
MEPGLFEIMYSLRAIRRLKPDRVPEDVVWKVLEAGTMAPSGGNSQPWRFVVLQDPELKRFVQERYLRVLRVYLQATAEAAGRRQPPPGPDEAARQVRTRDAALHLGEHLHEAPLLLLVCMVQRDLALLRDAQGNLRGPAVYSSIFPAVQNILLACRAFGLGATLTTLHLGFEGQIKERLGIPADVETVAMLPIGYPIGRFGPTRRTRVEDVTYWDGWNQLRARR